MSRRAGVPGGPARDDACCRPRPKARHPAFLYDDGSLLHDSPKRLRRSHGRPLVARHGHRDSTTPRAARQGLRIARLDPAALMGLRRGDTILPGPDELWLSDSGQRNTDSAPWSTAKSPAHRDRWGDHAARSVLDTSSGQDCSCRHQRRHHPRRGAHKTMRPGVGNSPRPGPRTATTSPPPT